jgi:alkylated DNA repair dioxygenase AlkB
VVVSPGAIYLDHFLTLDEQRAITARCFEIGAGDAGFYTPIVRGGRPMSVQMICLGRHWNALTYRYEDVRTDIDGRPAPPLPAELAGLAQRIADAAGFSIYADVFIVNWYRAGSRMGLHQV